MRQQIRAGAGRGLSAAQQPVAAAAMPAGSRSAADVFTAAPPQRSAGAVSAATPEHVAAAAAAVMSSLQTSMRQLQASVGCTTGHKANLPGQSHYKLLWAYRKCMAAACHHRRCQSAAGGQFDGGTFLTFYTALPNDALVSTGLMPSNG